MVNGLCAADPRSAGERRSDAAAAIANGNDTLACRCGSPHCPTAGVTPKSNVVIRVIADQTAVNEATATQPAATEAPPNPRPHNGRRLRRCCWAVACCRTRCWPRRSATARPSTDPHPECGTRTAAIGPATSWPSSSGCGICSADSPAARSPLTAATSTMSGRGRGDRRTRPI